MRFLFNKQVIFDADSGTLFLADTSDNAVQISNPTTRLLLLACHLVYDVITNDGNSRRYQANLTTGG